MYTVKNYCLAESLEQAYELNKKSRSNIIVGGNLWLKMGSRRIQNAIDLSLLGLDQIEETEEGFLIGCMVSLRELEVHQKLNDAYQDLFTKAMQHIVGVQFRNCATVGGSIFPRFGFSDVLTAFLACDSYVDLYHAGRISLRDFIDMPLDEDIITHMYIKKDQRRVEYQSFRMTETDFPTLTCAVVKKGDDYSAVIGARPKCARSIDDVKLAHPKEEAGWSDFADNVVEKLDYGSNMRGSAMYRRELSRILIKRCLCKITEDGIC